MSDLIPSLLPYTLITLAILTIVSLLRYLTATFNYWKILGIPYAQPISTFTKFLSTLTFRKSMGNFLTELYREIDEPYFGIWVFSTPHLIVKDPELIKNVLLKDFDYFPNKTTFNDKTIDPIGSRLLFFERMPDWLTSRRSLTVAFSSGKLKAMMPLIEECAVRMKQYVADKLEDKDRFIFEAKGMYLKFSVDVIASCAFGLNAGAYEETPSKFLECSRDMFGMDLDNAIRSLSYFFIPSLASTFKLTFAKPKIYEYLTSIFAQTIEMREKSGELRADLIDILIKIKQHDKLAGATTNQYKLLAHSVQFFIAGSETTSTTISFILYEMALDHKVQEKARRDIQNNLKKYGGANYDALNNMKYIAMCIQETLRKYPVLPFLDRRCMRDYKIPDGSGRVIKSGTPVYIPMFGLHYDPKYFPDPDRFDPERFHPDNTEQKERHPFSYLPFGQGPHICIGERFALISTKLCLIHILTNFKIDKCAETPIPIVFDPKSFLLMSKTGLQIQFSKL